MWKLYFWVYTVLSLIGLPVILATLPRWSFADARGTIESIVIVVGTYCYVYGKKLLTKQTWYRIFWVLTIVWSFDLLYAFFMPKGIQPWASMFEVQSVPHGPGTVVFNIVLALPALAAIYRLGTAPTTHTAKKVTKKTKKNKKR